MIHIKEAKALHFNFDEYDDDCDDHFEIDDNENDHER